MATRSVQECLVARSSAKLEVMQGYILRATISEDPIFENGMALTTLASGGEAVSFKMEYVVDQSDAELWLPKGAKVAICNPRFAKGSLQLSNFGEVQFEGFDTRLENAAQIREEGNRAFRSGQFLKAAMLYKECTSRSSDRNDIIPAWSNMAQAWLKLGCYESALRSAEIALALDPLHHKSLLRKSTALCGMHQYRQACDCLLPVSTVKECQAAYQACSRLLGQSETGTFDLSNFYICHGTKESIPECADYVGPVELGMSKGRGRGLFATRDLEPGDLLFVTNGIGYVDGGLTPAEVVHNARASQVLILRTFMNSGRARKQLMTNLDGRGIPDMNLFRPSTGQGCCDEDGAALFHWVEIVMNNLGKKAPGNQECYALYPLAGLMNHSCLPNASQVHVGSAYFVRAVKQVRAGEELTCTYTNPFLPASMRNKILESWNFSCTCERCRLEARLAEGRGILVDFQVRTAKEVKRVLTKGLASKLERKLAGSRLAVQEKQWIRAAYHQAYSDFTSEVTAAGVVAPCVEDIMSALAETAPGSLTLSDMVLHWRLNFKSGMQYVGNLYPEGRAAEILVKEVNCLYGERDPLLVNHINAMLHRMYIKFHLRNGDAPFSITF